MPDSSRRVLEGLQKLIPEVQSKNFSLRGAALLQLLQGKPKSPWRSGAYFTGNRVISNDAGRCKSFFSLSTLESNTPLRRRTNCVSFWSFCSSASPYLAQPFAFIHLVLPTSHLFDHQRPR